MTEVSGQQVVNWLVKADIFSNSHVDPLKIKAQGLSQLLEKNLEELDGGVLEQKNFKVAIELGGIYLKICAILLSQGKERKSSLYFQKAVKVLELADSSPHGDEQVERVNMDLRVNIIRALAARNEPDRMIDTLIESGRNCQAKGVDPYCIVVHHVLLSMGYLSTKNMPLFYNRARTLKDFLYRLSRIRTSAPFPQIMIAQVISMKSIDPAFSNPSVFSCCMVLSLILEAVTSQKDGKGTPTLSHAEKLLEGKSPVFVAAARELMRDAETTVEAKPETSTKESQPTVEKDKYVIKVNRNQEKSSKRHIEFSKSLAGQSKMEEMITMKTKKHPKTREVSTSTVFFRGLTIDSDMNRFAQFVGREKSADLAQSSAGDLRTHRRFNTAADREELQPQLSSSPQLRTSARSLHRKHKTLAGGLFDRALYSEKDMFIPSSTRLANKKSQRILFRTGGIGEDPWVKNDKQHTGIKIVRDKFDQSHHIRSYSNFIVYLRNTEEKNLASETSAKNLHHHKHILDSEQTAYLLGATSWVKKSDRAQKVSAQPEPGTASQKDLFTPRAPVSNSSQRSHLMSQKHSRRFSAINFQSAFQNEAGRLHKRSNTISAKKLPLSTEAGLSKEARLWDAFRTSRPSEPEQAHLDKKASSKSKEKVIRVKMNLPTQRKRDFGRVYGSFTKRERKAAPLVEKSREPTGQGPKSLVGEPEDKRSSRGELINVLNKAKTEDLDKHTDRDKRASSEIGEGAKSSNPSKGPLSSTSKNRLQPGKSSEAVDAKGRNAALAFKPEIKLLHIPDFKDDDPMSSPVNRKNSGLIESFPESVKAPDTGRLQETDHDFKMRVAEKVASHMIANFKHRVSKHDRSPFDKDSVDTPGIRKRSARKEEDFFEDSRGEGKEMISMLNQSSSSNRESLKRKEPRPADSESQKSKQKLAQSPVRPQGLLELDAIPETKHKKTADRSKFEFWSIKPKETVATAILELSPLKRFKALDRAANLYEALELKRLMMAFFVLDFKSWARRRELHKHTNNKILECMSLTHETADRFRKKAQDIMHDDDLADDSSDEQVRELPRRGFHDFGIEKPDMKYARLTQTDEEEVQSQHRHPEEAHRPPEHPVPHRRKDHRPALGQPRPRKSSRTAHLSGPQPHRRPEPADLLLHREAQQSLGLGARRRQAADPKADSEGHQRLDEPHQSAATVRGTRGPLQSGRHLHDLRLQSDRRQEQAAAQALLPSDLREVRAHQEPHERLPRDPDVHDTGEDPYLSRGGRSPQQSVLRKTRQAVQAPGRQSRGDLRLQVARRREEVARGSERLRGRRLPQADHLAEQLPNPGRPAGAAERTRLEEKRVCPVSGSAHHGDRGAQLPQDAEPLRNQTRSLLQPRGHGQHGLLRRADQHPRG